MMKTTILIVFILLLFFLPKTCNSTDGLNYIFLQEKNSINYNCGPNITTLSPKDIKGKEKECVGESCNINNQPKVKQTKSTNKKPQAIISKRFRLFRR